MGDARWPSNLVEAMRDRFPGTKTGRSCLNIVKPELIDDGAVRDLAVESWEQYKDGFHRGMLPQARA